MSAASVRAQGLVVLKSLLFTQSLGISLLNVVICLISDIEGSLDAAYSTILTEVGHQDEVIRN